MPDDTRLPARANNDLQTLPFDQAFDAFTPELETALPEHIPVDRFKRVVITAINNSTPQNNLAKADRRSLFSACVKCAHDGLYPDGREAALVVYNTKIKDKSGQEYWAPLVQYMPMIAGIRKRMRNTGEVLSADAQLVCRNDKFHYEFGDNPRLTHEPPPLGQERGDIIGSYAIIKLANGEILREVIGLSELERVRAFSKTKDGPAWRDHRGEMYRKTVMRRCSKAAPTGSDLERMLSRDDEIPQIESVARMLPVNPRPRLADYQHPRQPGKPPAAAPDEQPEAKTYTLVTADGEFLDFDTTTDAANALSEMLAAVRPRGLSAIDAVWFDNQSLVAILQENDTNAYHAAAETYDFQRAFFPQAAPDGPAQTPAVAVSPDDPPAAGEPLSERRPRGRPPGSRNKPSAVDAPETPASEPEPGAAYDTETGEILWEKSEPEPAESYVHNPVPMDGQPDLLVPFDGGNIQEWFGRARTRLRDMQSAGSPPEQFTAYRKANLGPMGRLKVELRSWHEQLESIIAKGERGRG